MLADFVQFLIPLSIIFMLSLQLASSIHLQVRKHDPHHDHPCNVNYMTFYGTSLSISNNYILYTNLYFDNEEASNYLAIHFRRTIG